MRYDDRFKRMWDLYLLSSAGSFRARKLQLWQFVMSRDGVPAATTPATSADQLAPAFILRTRARSTPVTNRVQHGGHGNDRTRSGSSSSTRCTRRSTSELERFLDDLHDEPRYFGPSASGNPKPFRSLIEALRRRDGFRLAAVECGRIVGVARVDEAGELFIAVTADRRGAGIGTTLGHAAVAARRLPRSPAGRPAVHSSQRRRAPRR